VKSSTVNGSIVTGGAGTLALSCARALLEQGVSKLILWDVDFEHALNKIKKLENDFPDAAILIIPVNVSDGEQVTRAIQQTKKMTDRINYLCCFAGVVGCKHVLDMNEQEWRRVVDINLTGMLLIMCSILPKFDQLIRIFSLCPSCGSVSHESQEKIPLLRIIW
jgi:sorbose reductase